MAVMQQILFDSLVIAFFVLGIGAVAAGLGLVVNSDKTFRLFAVMNRSISTRQTFKQVSVQREVEPVVRRHRIWFGLALVIGSLYALYGFGFSFNTNAVVEALDSGSREAYSPLPALVSGLRWALLAASLWVLVTGIMLVFTPGLLQQIETRVNRWYSLRKATAGLEREYHQVDNWAEAYPKTTGLIILFGALVVVVNSAVLLFV